MNNQDVAELLEKVMAVAQVLLDESDRGAILVAAAFIDEQLQALLTAKLVQSLDPAEDLKDERLKKYPESVFKDARLLQSTGNKEVIAFMCGLISQRELKECKVIRDIRNSLAHSVFSAGFDTQSIRDQCENLRKSRPADNVDLDGKLIADRRRMFLWAAARLAVTLAMRVKEITPLPRRQHEEPWDPGELRDYVNKTMIPNLDAAEAGVGHDSIIEVAKTILSAQGDQGE
jgi:hypothetical protein